MNFKLTIGFVLFVWCLYYMEAYTEAKPRKFEDRRCLASVYQLTNILASCHGRYVCDYYNGGTSVECIDKRYICNGIANCPGGEDEHNCQKKEGLKCGIDQIMCSDGKTCAKSCNGVVECEYQTDEQNCIPTCEKDQMVCLDGSCATPCDKIKQCKNGIDEANCVVCDNLPIVANGHYKSFLGTGKSGDVATLKCDTGFCLFPESLGAQSIKCETNGLWSEQGPGECLKDTNLAVGYKYVTQSSTFQTGFASLAVDGLRPNIYTDNDGNDQCSHTAADFNNGVMAWWELKLIKAAPITRLRITNRLEACCHTRLEGIRIMIGVGAANMHCADFHGPADNETPQHTIMCSQTIVGDTIRISILDPDSNLTLCEVEIFTC